MTQTTTRIHTHTRARANNKRQMHAPADATHPGGEREEGGVPGGGVEGMARQERVEHHAQRPDVRGEAVRELLVEDLAGVWGCGEVG